MLRLTVHDQFRYKLDRLPAVLPPGMEFSQGDAATAIGLVLDDAETGDRHVYVLGREEQSVLHRTLGEILGAKSGPQLVMPGRAMAVPRGTRR